MSDVMWVHAGGSPWVVTSRPADEPVVAGVTWPVGHMDQPTEQLGVLGLLAAWIVTNLRRPSEAFDPVDRADQVAFLAGETESALVVSGDVAGVTATLRRLDDVLAGAADVVVDDELRDRSRPYVSSLRG